MVVTEETIFQSGDDNRVDLHMPKGILLDLDDTILAFDAVADESWRRVLNDVARHLAPVTVDELFWSIKDKARVFWSDPERHQTERMNLASARQQIVAAALEYFHIANPPLSDWIATQYGSERDAAIQPFPGALETVRQLRQLGMQLALVTNGSAAGQRAKIERFALSEWFDCILIEGECGFGKPDERIYLQALNQLGLVPEQVWMVGDNLEWEVWAPQRLGIKGIWIDHSGTGLPPSDNATPFRIVRTLSDVLRLIGPSSEGR